MSFALLKQRRLQEAYDHAARVLVADPTSARAHALLGQAILASGDFKESVEEFRTALALDENEAMAVAGLAMVDFYENRLADCLKGMRKAVSMDSKEPDYVFSLGQAAARFEMFKEAADYERFLRSLIEQTPIERRIRGYQLPSLPGTSGTALTSHVFAIPACPSRLSMADRFSRSA